MVKKIFFKGLLQLLLFVTFSASKSWNMLKNHWKALKIMLMICVFCSTSIKPKFNKMALK